jgi:dimethylhistidine N-methyltransferase
VKSFALIDAFAADVSRDLRRTPKQLQSRYLYDELGSSLFEAICRLPWYPITRAEDALLRSHAPAIARELGGAGAEPVSIVELGVGSGEKLATLVRAIPAGTPLALHLIDISAAALAETAARLAGFPQVTVAQYEGTYEDGLRAAAGAVGGHARALALFLGSNIGNFESAAARALLASIRRALRPGDALLLGADLVKPDSELLLAYDDPLGVTAAFNKNLLVRINRELGGEFDVSAFEHRAIWNAGDQRVEMHLVSRIAQHVRIAATEQTVGFTAGETIWTESSYKYSEADIAALGSRAGFTVAEQWVAEPERFALTLFQAV